MAKVLKPTPSTVHWGYYSGNLEPVLHVDPGEPVIVETFSYPRHVGKPIPELIPPGLQEIMEKVTDVGPGGHLFTGPIYVNGARPGDVIAIHFDEATPNHTHGYNSIFPGREGRGALPEDFPEGRVKVLEVDMDRQVVELVPGVVIPLRPFFGNVGVAPPPSLGRVTSRIPGDHGGNLDITELSPPATLYLPVFVEGALVSFGDGHGVQGDGEVDMTALEIAMRGKVRFEIRRDFSLRQPMIETPTHIITTGFHEDLDEAMRAALRNMIGWLQERHGLEPLDAYTLCSLAVSLRVSQVVNIRKGIHAMLPKAVLTGARS